MMISKSRNIPKYICDKCGEEIKGYHKNSRQHIKPNKYYKNDQYGCPKKDFDLCDECEKKFREWLNTKELETAEEIINKFPRYEED